MTHALVTGASGFIGQHLVRSLSERGMKVSCLVRENSRREGVEKYAPEYRIGDITEPESLTKAVAGVDVVYHLAGLTKSLHRRELFRVNEEGTGNLANACANSPQPPRLVVASSLAAAGPATPERPRIETDPPNPVSVYGKSKLAGEIAASRFFDRVPTSIVRPPIVFGEGDVDGFNVFQTIAQMGAHFAPGFRNHLFSAIHAEDLVEAMVQVASNGQCVVENDASSGVYFAADPQTFTYAEYGRMIGRCLNRPHAWVIRSPHALVWGISAFNEAVARIRRRPHILNLDKVREASAGSWACSPAKLVSDTGFAPARPLEERINETVDWYVSQGWLQRKQRRD